MGRRRKDQRPEQDGSPQRDAPAAAAPPPDNTPAPRRSPRPWSRATVLGVCGFLLVAVGLVFGSTVRCEMVNFDDDKYVYDNPHVTDGLTVRGIHWALFQTHSSNWHPLTWMSHMLDCQLYGLDPRGHHLGNVLLHAAAAVLLFLVLLRMTDDPWPSALVAAVFAVHPLRVESVAWVAERKDVLSGVLFMLTVAAYVAYARQPSGDWRHLPRSGPEGALHKWRLSPSGRTILSYLVVMAAFALGLMAKPMLVTLPLVLLLLDYWPLGRWPKTGVARLLPVRLIVEKIPLAALSLASCVITLVAQTRAMESNAVIPLHWRVANAVVACAAYLGQLFWPVGLAAYYPHPINQLPIWKAVFAAVVLLGISAGVFFARRRFPCLVVGWLWYLVMLLPVIGLVQVGDQAMADRYTYLPLIGPCMAMAWFGARACRGRPRRVLAAGVAASLALAVLMVGAWRQTSYWHDSITLWNRVLQCAAENPRMHSNLGVALQAKGDNDAAMQHFQRAVELNPGYLEAINNLGNSLNQKGRFDEAIRYYQGALSVAPDCAEVHLNLGNALVQKGRFAEAIDHLQKARETLPDRSEVYYNLGNAMLQTGRPADAVAQYRLALAIRPEYGDALNNLGAALAELGKADEAIACYQKALAIEPQSADAHNNLGLALAQKGQVAEAMAEYRKSLQIRPGYADARNNLGAILADHGRVDEAIVEYRKILETNPTCAPAYQNLGGALCRQGKLAEALELWRTGIQRCPADVPLLNVTAWVLASGPVASLRNGPEAVALGRRAVELSGGRRPEVFDVLAAAHAEAGQFSDALAAARQALSLAEAQNNTALATTLRARIRLYQARSPVRSK